MRDTVQPEAPLLPAGRNPPVRLPPARRPGQADGVRPVHGGGQLDHQPAQVLRHRPGEPLPADDQRRGARERLRG